MLLSGLLLVCRYHTQHLIGSGAVKSGIVRALQDDTVLNGKKDKWY